MHDAPQLRKCLDIRELHAIGGEPLAYSLDGGGGGRMLPPLCRVVLALLRLLVAQRVWDLHRTGSTNRQGGLPSRCDQIRAMSVAKVTA